jgi:hypothetical protein
MTREQIATLISHMLTSAVSAGATFGLATDSGLIAVGSSAAGVLGLAVYALLRRRTADAG